MVIREISSTCMSSRRLPDGGWPGWAFCSENCFLMLSGSVIKSCMFNPRAVASARRLYVDGFDDVLLCVWVLVCRFGDPIGICVQYHFPPRSAWMALKMITNLAAFAGYPWIAAVLRWWTGRRSPSLPATAQKMVYTALLYRLACNMVGVPWTPARAAFHFKLHRLVIIFSFFKIYDSALSWTTPVFFWGSLLRQWHAITVLYGSSKFNNIVLHHQFQNTISWLLPLPNIASLIQIVGGGYPPISTYQDIDGIRNTHLRSLVSATTYNASLHLLPFHLFGFHLFFRMQTGICICPQFCISSPNIAASNPIYGILRFLANRFPLPSQLHHRNFFRRRTTLLDKSAISRKTYGSL